MPNQKSKGFTLKRELINLKHGFTLIELLVVIAIIGILATFIVASFTSAQQKGRDSKRKTDMDAVKKAMELGKSDCQGGYYPAPHSGTTGTILGLYFINFNNLRNHLISLGYLSGNYSTLNDPLASSGYMARTTNTSTTVCPDSSGGTTINGSYTYFVSALLENTNDPQAETSRLRCLSNPGVSATANGRYYVCPD